MPKETDTQPEVGSIASSGNIPNPQVNERVMAQLLQISNGSKPYTPTNAQVDKMLALHEKGMEYTHKERTTYLPKDIMHMTTYLFTALLVVAVFVFSVFYAKEYLGEIISATLGLVLGGVGGYGYGTSKNKEKKDE